ncbi:MAG: CAAD domain-containing protein [Phormidesmis sp. CAN_BIN36]|nr:CAAD domain-containing protein [Phormidesmis sp. CAN_BIN36]
MSVENAQTPGLVETQTTVVDVPMHDPVVVKKTTIETTQDHLQEKAVASEFINDPIGSSVRFLKPYTRILALIGWSLLAIVGFKLVLTLLGAILSVATSIPVLSPLFELVGVTYTGWFIYTQLLTATQRQEFSQKVSRFKK